MHSLRVLLLSVNTVPFRVVVLSVSHIFNKVKHAPRFTQMYIIWAPNIIEFVCVWCLQSKHQNVVYVSVDCDS